MMLRQIHKTAVFVRSFFLCLVYAGVTGVRLWLGVVCLCVAGHGLRGVFVRYVLWNRR